MSQFSVALAGWLAHPFTLYALRLYPAVYKRYVLAGEESFENMEMLLYIIPKVIPFDEMLANTRPLTAPLSFYFILFFLPPGLEWKTRRGRECISLSNWISRRPRPVNPNRVSSAVYTTTYTIVCIHQYSTVCSCCCHCTVPREKKQR